MAKSQKKSNREAKKPKKDKAAAPIKVSIVPPSGRPTPGKAGAAARIPD